MKFKKNKKIVIGIIGIGYVGLPLVICFAKKYLVNAFDINKKRILNLQKGVDTNCEFKKKEIKQNNIKYTSSIYDLSLCNYLIVSVPTPINNNLKPNLNYLKKANELVSKILKEGDTVIYESTVYPGLTEEYCIPQLEKNSNLRANKDFFYGYSPERVNPGDKIKKIENIIKVTSGSNEDVSKKIDKLYSSVIKAGTFRVSNIKIAESAKIIENIQRDINIALINELSVIFDKMKINSHEVLNAAATKWNFHKFVPGLVGGHCIGVDPYYLAFKANQIGVYPKMILAGRSINSNYYKFLSKKIIKNKGKKVLILGLTFKENCKDLRNSQIIKIFTFLKKKKFLVDIFDPVASKHEAKKIYNLKLINSLKSNKYDFILLAVGHSIFRKMKKKIFKSLKKDGKFYDLKNFFQNFN